MISAIRRIQFCYGHRVFQHESKCATLHGHNGVVYIHATSPSGLDHLGRVVDFSVLQETIGKWINENWDHRMILFKDDKKTIDALLNLNEGSALFIMNTNPTAENLAKFLLEELSPKLLYEKNVIVHKVVFWETENCCCEVELFTKPTA